MAVLPLPARSDARSRAGRLGPSEVVRIPGSAVQVAAVLAGMVNDGWAFESLPVTRGGGLWLVSARRPLPAEQVQRQA